MQKAHRPDRLDFVFSFVSTFLYFHFNFGKSAAGFVRIVALIQMPNVGIFAVTSGSRNLNVIILMTMARAVNF